MKEKKLAVFSWDGTLSDNVQNFVQAAETALQPLGIRIDLPRLRKAFDPSLTRLYQNLNTGQPTSNAVQRSQQLLRETFAETSLAAPLRPGFHAAMRDLMNAGYRLIVLGDRDQAELEADIERHGVGGYFDRISGREGPDRSRLAKTEWLKFYMEENGYATDDVTIVDSTAEGTKIARALGITSVAITEGYASDSLLIMTHPDALIDDLSELSCSMQPVARPD